MTDQRKSDELETTVKSQTTSESLFDVSGFKTPEVSPGNDPLNIPLDADGNEIETGEAAASDIEEPPATSISFDDFYSMFQMAFAAPGEYDEDFKPLAIQPDEDKNARAAAQVTYDLIQKYVPSWLVDFDSKWMLWISAGMFFMGKAKILALILAHKRQMRAIEIEAEERKRADAGQGGEAGPESPVTTGGVDWLKPVRDIEVG